MKVAFVFCDTFLCGRYAHCGMALKDISHLQPLWHNMTEGLHVEVEEDRGINDGFAGLVLISDEIFTPQNQQSPPKSQISTKNTNKERKSRNSVTINKNMKNTNNSNSNSSSSSQISINENEECIVDLQAMQHQNRHTSHNTTKQNNSNSLKPI